MAALIIEDRRGSGVFSFVDGRTIRCDAVIITTGTFLNGLAHIGEQRVTAAVETAKPPSQVLARPDPDARVCGWTRLKTGTPPRLDARTIDWSQFEPQFGRCRTRLRFRF